jgi:hypothetical protein
MLCHFVTPELELFSLRNLLVDLAVHKRASKLTFNWKSTDNNWERKCCNLYAICAFPNLCMFSKAISFMPTSSKQKTPTFFHNVSVWCYLASKIIVSLKRMHEYPNDVTAPGDNSWWKPAWMLFSVSSSPQDFSLLPQCTWCLYFSGLLHSMCL